VLSPSARHYIETVTSLSEEPPSPIGEDDRDAAVRRLQEAYAEGHISHEHMDEGLDRVLTAEGRGELVSVLDSLPAEKPGSTSTIAAAGGRIRRGGSWRVPRILKVESAFGRVRLDLSRAVIEHPVVDIQLRLGTVPAGPCPRRPSAAAPGSGRCSAGQGRSPVVRQYS
jgi:hypothetical protein